MNISGIKNNLTTFFRELKVILRLLLPQSKKEGYLLAGLTVFYFLIGIYLALNTSIMHNPEIGVDIYFSFDNSKVYVIGYENHLGHPLMVFITRPFILLGDTIAFIFNDAKAKTIFLSLICSLLISSSVVYVNRYLREIILLRGYILYLITFFFAFLSTNLILSFTPESFTIVSFLLCFIIYYYSKRIFEQTEKSSPFSIDFLFAVLLGGVTITNIAKAIVPMFYLKRKPIVIVKQIVIIGFFFLLAYLILPLFSSANEMSLSERVTLFSLDSGNMFKYASELFFGAPMLFPSIIISHTDPFLGGELRNVGVISLDFYQHWWQYLIVGTIFVFIIASAILNYKNKFVQILLLCFGVDIFIHVIMRYGLMDPFLYGGHWVFCIPLLLGWLYKALDGNLKKVMSILLTFLFLALVINNLYQLKEFILIATQLFPPIS